ncbi:MAG: TolC family protein, partial [Owenweeksia sp.]
MGKSFLKTVWIFPALLVVVQSCFVAKNYERPEEIEVQAQKLFRTDSLPEDSLSMADISWRELFTDPILVAHIEKALQNNIDIRIALQQIITAEAYLKQGKLGYLPSVNGTLQNSYQETSDNSQFGNFFNTLSQNQLSATATWEADIWGKIRSQKRAYEAGYLQSVAAHQAVKTRLIASVANTYYQLLSLDEQISVTDTTVQNRTRSLETTRALKDAGSVTEVGVQQTEAQLYTAQAILVNLENQRRRLENAFSILLGEEPQAIERGKLQEQYITVETDLGYSMSMLENRPDVRAAEFELISAFELTNVA